MKDFYIVDKSEDNSIFILENCQYIIKLFLTKEDEIASEIYKKINEDKVKFEYAMYIHTYDFYISYHLFKFIKFNTVTMKDSTAYIANTIFDDIYYYSTFKFDNPRYEIEIINLKEKGQNERVKSQSN